MVLGRSRVATSRKIGQFWENNPENMQDIVNVAQKKMMIYGEIKSCKYRDTAENSKKLIRDIWDNNPRNIKYAVNISEKNGRVILWKKILKI